MQLNLPAYVTPAALWAELRRLDPENAKAFLTAQVAQFDAKQSAAAASHEEHKGHMNRVVGPALLEWWNWLLANERVERWGNNCQFNDQVLPPALAIASVWEGCCAALAAQRVPPVDELFEVRGSPAGDGKLLHLQVVGEKTRHWRIAVEMPLHLRSCA